MTVYVNGEPGQPNNVSLEDSEGNYLIGLIGELVLIAEALSGDEVRELMDKGVMGILAVNPGDKLPSCWARIKSGSVRRGIGGLKVPLNSLKPSDPPPRSFGELEIEPETLYNLP